MGRLNRETRLCHLFNANEVAALDWVNIFKFLFDKQLFEKIISKMYVKSCLKSEKWAHSVSKNKYY